MSTNRSKIYRKIMNSLEASGALVEASAKLLCPVDLGRLRDSIHHKVNMEDLSVTIGTNVEYAAWVEFGTGEKAEKGDGRKGGWVYQSDHKQAKGLLIGETKDGKYLYFTRGSKPQPFLRPALLENKENIRKIFEKGKVGDSLQYTGEI